MKIQIEADTAEDIISILHDYSTCTHGPETDDLARSLISLLSTLLELSNE